MDHRTCYRGADFRGADLTDEDLTQFDLTHAVLDGCTLTDDQREYCVSMGYIKAEESSFRNELDNREMKLRERHER